MNSLYVDQPLNTPFYTDFSGNDKVIVGNTNVVIGNAFNPRIIAFFINREMTTSQFPCFDLTVSFNVF